LDNSVNQFKNRIIKAVKEENGKKDENDEKDRHLERPLVKSSTLHTSRKPKSLTCHSRNGFCIGTADQVHIPVSFQESLASKGFKTTHPIFPSGLFSLPKSEVGAGWPLAIQDGFKTS
jgi:hypothetical protein